MASAFLLVGKLAFAGIGVAVGVKLAATSRQRGALGLHTVALAAICIGGVGMLVMPAAKPLGAPGLAVLAELAVRAAMLLLCAFVAGTFRPNPAGIALAAVCGVLLVAAMVWDLQVQPSLLDYDYTRMSSHANQLSIAAPFAWSAVESGILWRRARRRLALGLSDPEVVQRYLLWSVTTGCFVAIAGLAVVAGVCLAAGGQAIADLAQASRGLLYGIVTACIWRGIFLDPSGSEAPAGA